MQVIQDVIPLSCKGRWQNDLANPVKDKNILIKDLSYELMLNFLDMRHEENWDKLIKLEFLRYKVKERATPEIFIKMMMKGKLKIQYLRKLAGRIKDLSVETCFFQIDPNYKVHENLRMQADQDTSRGYLKDISYETLKEIAKLIKKYPSWKRMGDGLGFNLQECFSFSDPYEVLKKWMAESSDGTLSRIYYEVERLGCHDVCKYLDGIPLHKMSSIVPCDPHSFYPELRPVTIFDLDKLDNIYSESCVNIDWDAIAHVVFNSVYSKKQDLWLSGNVTLAQLNEAFNKLYNDSVMCFWRFLLENIEPSNRLGVTYNQVAFLGSAIGSDSAMTQVDFFKLITKEITSCDFRIKELSIPNLLCVYWQINRELDLTVFFDKTFDLICFDYSNTARLLGCAYELINPKRYYTDVSSQQLVNLNSHLEDHKSSK